MNLKKIIATLSFLLLLNCGYEPIYSKKQINSNYNFSINTINYIGDNKVNQILKNQLQKILNKEKKKFQETFEYDNISNKFNLKQYEKNIKDNLISKLSYKIIRYLNFLK